MVGQNFDEKAVLPETRPFQMVLALSSVDK